jgi:hypothetical protein
MRFLRNAVLVTFDAVLITVFVLAVHAIWLRNVGSALLRRDLQKVRYGQIWEAAGDTWKGLARMRSTNLD